MPHCAHTGVVFMAWDSYSLLEDWDGRENDHQWKDFDRSAASASVARFLSFFFDECASAHLFAAQSFRNICGPGSLHNLVTGCQVFLMMRCRFMKGEDVHVRRCMSETLALKSKNVRWERALWLKVWIKETKSLCHGTSLKLFKVWDPALDIVYYCLLMTRLRVFWALGLLAGFNTASGSTYATPALEMHTWTFLCLCPAPRFPVMALILKLLT